LEETPSGKSSRTSELTLLEQRRIEVSALRQAQSRRQGQEQS
jgi:hypothetical protein